MPTTKIRERRTQEERTAASTEAMLEAAIDLILESGTGVSMMAIGKKSGYSHGLVQSRFGSKSELIDFVTREVQSRFIQEIGSAIEGKRGLDALLSLVDVYLQPLRRNGTVGKAFYVLLGEALGPEPEIRKAFTEADEIFRGLVGRLLEQAKSAGELDPKISVDATALLLVGMLRGTAMQFRVNPKAGRLDAVREVALKMIDGIRARETGTPHAAHRGDEGEMK